MDQMVLDKLMALAESDEEAEKSVQYLYDQAGRDGSDLFF